MIETGLMGRYRRRLEGSLLIYALIAAAAVALHTA
jgi:hypothetical protein